MTDSSADMSPTKSEPASLREAWVALTGLSLVFLFEMLDNSVLNVALPTIGRDLGASATQLQWVTSVYALVFGSLMLVLAEIADRIGQRRMMLAGLVVLAVASAATALVQTPTELIVIRAVMGFAAGMTTPGSLALAFRLFSSEGLRVRATTVISTVGLVGMAVGPTIGGLVLAIAPWQVLLLANVPVALLALAGILRGIAADTEDDRRAAPIDGLGAVLGTVTMVAVLLAPTLFVDLGTSSPPAWIACGVAVAGAVMFIAWDKRCVHPLLDLELIARPMISSGLAFKASASLVVAGMGYLVTLEMQLDWGWSAFQAALGMLPQVLILVFGGAAIAPLMRRFSLGAIAWMSSLTIVLGIAVYAAFGRSGYVPVAVALVLVAAGMRVVGLVAGTNVMQDVPKQRSTVGAALVDMSGEITTGIGIAIVGTLLAAIFVGEVTSSPWTAAQSEQFEEAMTIGAWVLTMLAATLTALGMRWMKKGIETE